MSSSAVPVVKPLVVDGSVKSHALFLAYDHISLSELEAPMVLQEFINHSMGSLLSSSVLLSAIAY